jgi:hypothetical protein
MPTDIADALGSLIGDTVTLTTRGGRFTGTVAGVTDRLVTLCASGGVVYLRPSDVLAVSTGAAAAQDP